MIDYVRKQISVYNAPILRFFENNSGTILRTVIYTIGHFIIAATCVWYFLLDKFWASKMSKVRA